MKLEDFRAQIDAIDGQMLELLARRMEIVEKVGHLKRTQGVKGTFIRPKREDDMMKAILARGAGSFPREALFSIWRTIISASLQVENPFRVLATNANAKEIYEYFGSFSEYVFFNDEAEVLKNLTETDVGVLPNGSQLLAKLPANTKIFAKLGNYSAFANIGDE